jgi:hypothetical protein
MNFKKISIVASLIFLLELLIFIIENYIKPTHRNFEFIPLILWLILNSFIIAITILSLLRRLTKQLLFALAILNFILSFIVLLGIGFSGISYLLYLCIAAMILNIYLIILGLKREKE